MKFKDKQRRWLLSAVAVAALVVASTADTITTVYPGKDDVVSDCPSFQWYSCASCKEAEYTVKITSVSTGATIIRTSRTTTLEAKPEDDSELLDIGEYTWQVSQGSITSAVIPFRICSKSCLPPKVDNKVDNTLERFTFTTFARKTTGAKFTVTKESGEVLNVLFSPVAGTQILDMTHHYRNNGTTLGTATEQFKVSRGDNILTMRYVYYSNSTYPLNIEILDSSNNVVRKIGCIGNEGSGCTVTTTALVDEKWGNVFFYFDPLPEKATYKLRFSIEKENEMGLTSSVVVLMNDIVLGQCSSLEDRNSFPTLSQCQKCSEPGLWIPENRTCATCTDIKSDSACCASIDYCTACLSTAKCEATSVSTCKSDAQCESLSTRESCLDVTIDSKRKDCRWCPIDKKCLFHADFEASCSKCSSFSSSSTCPSSECQWCPVTRRCVPNDETCPSCESVMKDSCTLAHTDNECQYCTAKSACLQKDAECTNECTGLSTLLDCSANTDCAWCSSSEACFERRIPCKTCAAMNLNSSCGSFPGCRYCETGFCRTKTDSCPTCGGRAEGVCSQQGEQTLLCKFCPSNRTCMDSAATCDTCSKVTDSTACNSYAGCTFCISTNMCQDSNETCEQCARMSMGQCAKYPAGCCWSQKSSHCFDLGATECESGLSAAYIALIAVAAVVVVALIVVAIVVPICCCRKDKNDPGIALSQTGTSIVVLPEGEASFVAPESLQTVALDPNAAATPVSVAPADASATPVTMMSQQPNQISQADMQTMMAQQQQQMNVMMSSMLAQQQQMSAMMMNPMMMNSMGMNGMAGMNSMGGMGGMNSMGGMNGMNGMNGMSMDMNMMGTAGVPAPPDQPEQTPPPPPPSS